MDPAMPGMDMGGHHAGPAHHARHVRPAPTIPAPPAAATAAAAPPAAPMPASPAAAEPSSPAGQPAGTDQSPGNAEPPPVADDHPADRSFDPLAMARARAAAMGPAPRYAQLRIDLAEYQLRNGRDGYRWEGEAWTGDLDRLLFRSKGDGTFGHGVDSAELQALYSHAIDPWWNLQVGVRQDIRPGPARSHATIGIEGLAPYRFDVLAAAYLSDKGQLTARLEASLDQRLTRRLILQPRLELDLSAQDMPAQRLGAGLDTAEFGLRLRCEVSRQFAPYLGISWTWSAGRTADYARADGDAPHQRSLVFGIRTWF